MIAINNFAATYAGVDEDLNPAEYPCTVVGLRDVDGVLHFIAIATADDGHTFIETFEFVTRLQVGSPAA